MKSPRTYNVKLAHDHYPPLNGILVETRVTSNSDGTRYVTSHPGGCSRDYAVATDAEAIRAMWRERGAVVVDID